MGRTFRCHPRLRLLRNVTAGLWAVGMPLIGTGCAGMSRVAVHTAEPAAPPMQAPAVPATVQWAPAPQMVGQTIVHTVDADKPHEMPITLDTVLRLAEDHNPKIALAREKVHDSQLEQEKNCRAWLPDVYAGMGYFRHEGGIQDFQGSLIHSSTQAFLAGLNLESELDLREATFRHIKGERDIWQQKAELSQIDSEVLLESATTYIDLLVAQRAEAIARELEQYEQKVLDRAKQLAKTEAGRAGMVEGVQAVLNSRQRALAKLKQQRSAASAKLVYLLGLPPETVLVPMDKVLAPIELVDVTPPVHDLVAQALANGPAVRELEGMLAVIQTGIDKSYGLHNLLPSLKVCALEGLFGAGPGSDMTFDNRLDFGVQVRWNLTQLAHADHMRAQARSKQLQAMLNYDDVRGKLAASVQDSRDTIVYGREQIGLSRDEIKNAGESYQQNNKRLLEGLPGGSVSDTLVAIRALEQAHFDYLGSISSHNKAQLRLLLLLGVHGGHEGAVCHP
jgi:outer membrane protein TolC